MEQPSEHLCQVGVSLAAMYCCCGIGPESRINPPPLPRTKPTFVCQQKVVEVVDEIPKTRLIASLKYEWPHHRYTSSRAHYYLCPRARTPFAHATVGLAAIIVEVAEVGVIHKQGHVPCDMVSSHLNQTR